METLMRIDPNTMHHPAYRPFSMLGAVACALDKIDPGSSLVVTDFVNLHGEKMKRNKLDATIFKAKGDRVFTVRASPDAFVVIYRIS